MGILKIPAAVLNASKLYGNKVSFYKMADGKELYSVCSVDKEDNPIPTGLPLLLIYDGEKVEVISGMEALELI